MGVSAERWVLLSRSSYQSCLLTKRTRAAESTDGHYDYADRSGAELLRQQCDSPMERFWSKWREVVAEQ